MYIKGFGPGADGRGRRKYQNISDSQGTLRYARDPAPAYAQPLPGDPAGASPYRRRIDSPRARAAASGWCANPGRSSAAS
ncbi:hypothetical protein GCM10010278_00260 [Streptomyces melanogenes]|nr:hypothetical protein GCM10010278_00260 [Streptomyces melanogenes]